MTLAGFDGLKIQRSDQSIVFLGDGSENGKVPLGSLSLSLDKEVMNAFDDARALTYCSSRLLLMAEP